MRLDTANLSLALGKHLFGFFNELWGGPEAAARDLLGDLSFAAKSSRELSDLEASRMLQVFIDHYDAVAGRAGWRSKSLLACAIAAESWIEHLGDQEEEAFALLGVRRLLDATGAIAGIDDLSAISLRAELDSRLEHLGVMEIM